MSSSTTHPLTGAWLRDLELLLHGIDPGERAEVLAGVREHLDGSLPPEATDDDVRRVLADLGSPQAVADEAYAGRPAPTSAAPAERGPVMSRPWVPVVVGLLLGLCLIWMTLAIGSIGGYMTSSTGGSVQVSPTGEEIGPVQTQVSYDGDPFTGLLIGLVTSPLLWVPGVALVLFSPLWHTRQKIALCLLTPVAALLISGSPAAGWALTHQEIGINVGAWAGLAAALGGGGWLLVRLCLTAARASRHEVSRSAP